MIPGKPYRIVAKVKNNRLWRAVQDIWPDCDTQSEAARRLGLTPSAFGDLLNMTKWPGKEVSGRIRWSPVANTVATRLAQEPGYLFEPRLYGRQLNIPHRIEFEIGIKELEERGVYQLPPPPEQIMEAAELVTSTRKALSKLKPREEVALRLRYGLDDGDGNNKTFVQIGTAMGVSTERARQLVARAERTMRAYGDLQQFVDDDSIIPRIKREIAKKRQLMETDPFLLCKFIDVLEGRCTQTRDPSGFCARHKQRAA